MTASLAAMIVLHPLRHNRLLQGGQRLLASCSIREAPEQQAAIGRTRKPIANTAAVFISCTVWLPEGKNTGAKYSEKDA